ncbi:Uncharacterised protein [Mycobacteroides abscessus subsp. abscessus]|nr:Uncharacterised protein [Mycobacteroides abscessus subsp. abscessus]
MSGGGVGRRSVGGIRQAPDGRPTLGVQSKHAGARVPERGGQQRGGVGFQVVAAQRVGPQQQRPQGREDPGVLGGAHALSVLPGVSCSLWG